MRSIYPEQTQQEYNIPYIHLRGLFARNYESSIKPKDMDMQQQQSQLSQQQGDATNNGQDFTMFENTEVFRQPSRQRTPNNNGKGIRFIIHQVTNYAAK